MEVIDLREKSEELEGDNFQLRLFEAFRNQLLELEVGKYDIIGIDPMSDLYFGSFFFVGQNSKLFGKSPQRYNGREGVIAQWADTKLWWKKMINNLKPYCQTLVLTSHPKDLYDKSTKLPTGRKAARGADITEAVSLQLWLFKPEDKDHNGLAAAHKNHVGNYWTLVKKNRLSYHVPNERTGIPRVAQILPNKIVPEVYGQTPVELIMAYMKQPMPDYGDLNKIIGEPTRPALSEEDRKAREQIVLEQKLELEIANAKRSMSKRLIDGGYFTDIQKIALAINKLDMKEAANSLLEIESVEVTLIEYADGLKQDG